MDEKNIEEKVRINSPKLKVEKKFESNYEKDKEQLTYSIDMYNEKKDSVAKNIVLKDVLDTVDIDKESIRVVDETGKEIPKDKYTIEEKKDKNGNNVLEIRFKDVYLIDKETNKEEIAKKQNISGTSMFRKVGLNYNVRRNKNKVKRDIHTKTVLNSNGNILNENDEDSSGISAKVTTNVLSVGERAVEEEEFKKKTNLKITKKKEKEKVKDGEKNTYNIIVKNIGENPARIVKIEDTIEGKSTIDKDSIRVLNSRGEDVTNSKNIIGITKEDRKSSSRNR